MKKLLLDKFFAVRGNVELENVISTSKGNVVCAYDCDNGIFFIQIWLNDGPIVSYESSYENKNWVFCAWAGCNKDSRTKFNKAICEALIKKIKTASVKKYRVKTIQMSLF